MRAGNRDNAMAQPQPGEADAAPVRPEQEQAPQAEDAVPAAAPAAPPAAPAPVDVLAMLARVEEQLAQISTVQQGHEQRLLELAGRPAPAGGEQGAQPTLVEFEERERELHTMRKRLSEVRSQLWESAAESVEADGLRQQLEEMRTQIQDLVRQAEETHREFYDKIQAMEKAQRMVKAYQARLEALDQEAGDSQGDAVVQGKDDEGAAPVPSHGV
jgi:predicted  nucleic acid-binding Zn-ribbon protein